MVWLLHLHHNGCGVSIYYCVHEQTLPKHDFGFPDFVVSRVTPTIHTRLGYKMFLMFASLNIGVMAPFALCVFPPSLTRLLSYNYTV
jgi:hypothetical protein